MAHVLDQNPRDDTRQLFISKAGAQRAIDKAIAEGRATSGTCQAVRRKRDFGYVISLKAPRNRQQSVAR